METITVEKRDMSVKAKKLRREGIVPGSVFGGALAESISIQMDELTARRLISKYREGSRVKLSLDGKLIPVQIKEKSVDTLKNQILEISFQALKADQKVKSVIHVVPVNFEKIADLLERMELEIPYSALPADMIDTVSVDCEGMPMGTVVTVADIPELNNDKIELHVEPDEIVFRIHERMSAADEQAEGESEE